MTERDTALITAVRAGRPHDVVFHLAQPVGTWSQATPLSAIGELLLPVHTGPFFPPLHTIDAPGYSYLLLFEDRYQAVAEAWLGSFPRTRDLRECCEYLPNWVTRDLIFDATITLKDKRMWKMRIGISADGIGASKLLEMLPLHKVMVG
ncbi:hypothetical protein LTR56_010941 [Elasticomyces elasticus]|nr:hypothetical protein LTR56_010941 [Elasticomyces elasticus]KAK3662640.1 hypothetical protein LTR22_006490 [Elasticomyces elasticus]